MLSFIMRKYTLIFVCAIFTSYTSAQEHIGRRMPSFIGTRGKKSMAEADKTFSIYDVVPRNRFQLENMNGFRYFIPKRGHPTGFQGTRGKKDMDFMYKRLGFNAVRGKRSDKTWYSNSGYEDHRFDADEFFKRKFYGMRGKKLPITFKLMGVRGKKGPSSMSFFGTRGKRNGIPIINDDVSDEDLTTIILYLLANSNKDVKNNVYDSSEFETSNSDTGNISYSQNQQDQPNRDESSV